MTRAAAAFGDTSALKTTPTNLELEFMEMWQARCVRQNYITLHLRLKIGVGELAEAARN